MRINDFEAQILGGKREDSRGYVEIGHERPYSIRLKSFSNKRADVTIIIDGKTVGTWRLNSYQETIIRRPSDDNRQFVALFSDTAEGCEAGLDQVSRSNLGLIQIIFNVEIESRPQAVSVKTKEYQSYLPKPRSFQSMSVGTGLGEDSGQNFDSTLALGQTRTEAQINFRLIRSQESKYGIVNGRANSNPIPPAVE